MNNNGWLKLIFEVYKESFKDNDSTELNVNFGSEGAVSATVSKIIFEDRQARCLSEVSMFYLQNSVSVNSLQITLPSFEIRSKIDLGDRKFIWFYDKGSDVEKWDVVIMPTATCNFLKSKRYVPLHDLIRDKLAAEKKMEQNGRINLPDFVTDKEIMQSKNIILSANSFYINVSYDASKQ